MRLPAMKPPERRQPPWICETEFSEEDLSIPEGPGNDPGNRASSRNR